MAVLIAWRVLYTFSFAATLLEQSHVAVVPGNDCGFATFAGFGIVDPKIASPELSTMADKIPKFSELPVDKSGPHHNAWGL